VAAQPIYTKLNKFYKKIGYFNVQNIKFDFKFQILIRNDFLCNNYTFVIINVFLYFLSMMIYLSPMSSPYFSKKKLKVKKKSVSHGD
jgi:hypothetical protein